MRYLTAMLGVLAMLLSLSGPVAALAATAPCPDMGTMVMAGDIAPCKTAAKSCADPCLASGKCQTQCGSAVPCVAADLDDFALSPFTVKISVAVGEQLSGTISPVDGPPPRL
jgi:hypothetical protein